MDNNIPEATVLNEEGTVRKRKPLNKYVKIGLVAFIVIALSIWFYYTFFEQHSLFGFFEVAIKSLRPFIIGAILAYLLKPICAVFEKWLSKAFVKVKNRNTARNLTINIAIGLTAVLFVAVVSVMFAAVIPQVVDSAKAIAGNVPGWIDSATAWLEKVTKNLPNIQAQIKDFSANFSEKMTDVVNKFMSTDDNASTVIFSVTTGVKETLILLKDILIGGVSCIYILHERKKFAAQGKMLVYGVFKKKWADKIMEELRFTDKMFGGYINGTIIDSFIIGLICFGLCVICKVPYAVLVSVIVGVTNIIPFFGPFIGGIPAVMIVLMVSPLRGFILRLLLLRYSSLTEISLSLRFLVTLQGCQASGYFSPFRSLAEYGDLAEWFSVYHCLRLYTTLSDSLLLRDLRNMNSRNFMKSIGKIRIFLCSPRPRLRQEE